MKTKTAFLVVLGVLFLLGCSAWAQNQDKKLIDSIQGPALYKAYCASCHGLQGHGDGPVAKSLKVRVSDLTRIAAHNGGKFPRMRIEGIILGENVLPAHGTREMPLWGPIFSQVGADQDLGRVRVDNLARYIESIQTK